MFEIGFSNVIKCFRSFKNTRFALVFYKKAAMVKIVFFKRNIFEAAAVKGSMTLYAFNNSVDEHSDAAMNNK